MTEIDILPNGIEPCFCGGTLIKEVVRNSIEITCSRCKRGYHMPLVRCTNFPWEHPDYVPRKIIQKPRNYDDD